MTDKHTKRFFYIGYFDVVPNDVARNVSPAAINKMSYIAKTIVKTGRNVTIISPALPLDANSGPQKESSFIVSPGVDLKQAPVFPVKNIFGRFFRRLRINHWLFKTLFSNVKKGDEVLVYHSLAMMNVIKKILFFKKICLILEVEEIYTDFNGFKKHDRKTEIKYLKSADRYIFSNDLLQEVLSITSQKCVVCYGSYEIPKVLTGKILSSQISLVYAGSFQKENGVFEVIEASKYLSSAYVLHILGFGNDNEVVALKEKILQFNLSNVCQIVYHGKLVGDDLVTFLQSCDIGLCPSNPQLSFNRSSFHSKILTYLANDLEVVAARIPALERSAVKNHLNFYDGSVVDLAHTIQKIDSKDKTRGTNILYELDSEFQKSISDLLI